MKGRFRKVRLWFGGGWMILRSLWRGTWVWCGFPLDETPWRDVRIGRVVAGFVGNFRGRAFLIDIRVYPITNRQTLQSWRHELSRLLPGR